MDKSNLTIVDGIVVKKRENIMGKGGNGGKLHFIGFLTFFSKTFL